MEERTNINTKDLVDTLVKGLQEEKALDIVKIDLSGFENSVTKYFVVCHGTSNVHVDAIGRNIQDYVHEKVWHKEGFENSQWIILDYADVVLHIFQKKYRDFYCLEELWADAEHTTVD